MRRAAVILIAAVLAAAPAHAERADREKPLNIEADRMLADDGKQTVIFEGRVVLTLRGRLLADAVVRALTP